jgi:hypothetical protein
MCAVNGRIMPKGTVSLRRKGIKVHNPVKIAAICEDKGEPCLEQLELIETGSGPRIEAELLKELLAGSPGLELSLADPLETHHYHNPSAAVNAYKHRLHGLRCEYVNARVRIYDLETRLDQSQYHREVLEKKVRFLENTLEQMRASRGWKLVEQCNRWRRNVSGWLQRLLRVNKAEPRP